MIQKEILGDQASTLLCQSLGLSVEKGFTELSLQSVRLVIIELSEATFPVSNGNNTIGCNFLCFAANDIKGRQFATGAWPPATKLLSHLTANTGV